jgi:hypothetical protein
MEIRNLYCASISAATLVIALQATGFAQDPETAPLCNHNGPYVAECNGQFSTVPVTSAGSYDPDGTPITVLWFEECAWGFFDDPTSTAPNFVIDMGFNCTRNCVFALRVYSGGQMQNCVSNTTVQDTTAPAISTLADIVDIWGVPIDTFSTGVPTAFDACDPAPIVQQISELHSGSIGPGHEDTITRQWSATDNCGFASLTTQRITLLSPLPNSSNLEVDVNQCDDIFDRGNGSNTFELTLLGRTGTLVSSLKLTSLKLSRLGDQTNFVWPVNPNQFIPADVAINLATRIGDCNPPGLDGKADLRLSFDRLTVRSALGLDTLPVDTIVYVAITGQRKNGTPFIAGGKMLVH